MSKKALYVNPKLIAVVTGCEVSDLPQNPTADMLPGKWTKVFSKNSRQISTTKKVNRTTLICEHCEKSDRYDLGTIAYDMGMYMANEDGTGQGTPNYQKALEFLQAGGYFRCSNCNGAGKWTFKDNLFMFGVLTSLMAGGREDEIMLGTIQLYDGSRPRWGTDAEESFLKSLSQDRHNALLWNKLGNMYLRGGRPELACVAFEQSLQADPQQTESHYSLATLLYQIGELEAAAFHNRMMLSSAAQYDKLDAVNLRELLATGLQGLMDIHLRDKSIPFLPTLEELQPYMAQEETAASIEHRQLEFREMDLFPEDKESFYPLAEMYMRHRAKEIPASERKHEVKARKVHVQAGSSERAMQITRMGERLQIPVEVGTGKTENLYDLVEALQIKFGNADAYAPCPCGQMTKYKFCCMPRMKKRDIEVFIADFGV